jgi:hypothetical protein
MTPYYIDDLVGLGRLKLVVVLVPQRVSAGLARGLGGVANLSSELWS